MVAAMILRRAVLSLASCALASATPIDAQGVAPEKRPGPAAASAQSVDESALLSWLAVHDDCDAQYVAFARYRRAFESRHQVDWVASLDRQMRHFAAPDDCFSRSYAVARRLRPSHEQLAAFVVQVRSFCLLRGRAAAALPWLLLASRSWPQHVEVRLLTLSAWAQDSPVHNTARATQELLALRKLLTNEAQPVGLSTVVALSGMTRRCSQLQWLRSQLREAEQALRTGGSLPHDWLLRARLTELDAQFERAVQRGDRQAIESCARIMLSVRPASGHELLLAAILVSRGSDRVREAKQLARAYAQSLHQATDQGVAIRARLTALGFVQAAQACGLRLLGVGDWFDDGPIAKVRLMYPDAQSLQNRRSGLRRAMTRADQEIEDHRVVWQRHHDKQQQMQQRSQLAGKRMREAYWRQQAARQGHKKDRHAGVIRSKQGDLARYRAELEQLDRTSLRMREFTLGATAAAQVARPELSSGR